MARPKYAVGDQTAKEKLAAAFWRLLADKPYAKLSALDVVREAGINKNTFYYHYTGIDDMAADAVDSTLDPTTLLATLSSLRSVNPVTTPMHTPLDANLDRLCLVAGEHSTPALRLLLKNALRSAWCEALGIDQSQLELQQQIALEFALGGVLEVMAYRSRVATAFNFATAAGVLVRDGVLDAILRSITQNQRPQEVTTPLLKTWGVDTLTTTHQRP